ncbi:AfsR/SARP family transcriptional regulator [Gandjariella thermophila]|uniref:AfsR/SARP family transcriptional regulator n=1 Tax=Gandjariella thermophila TaxID=1931992 RepID=UPI001CEFAD2D|nr:AfsR/SARP family transcriptional regulator [Gandjariella thermophila]
MPKPRQVLALLVTHADKVVPTSAFLRELWDGTPPRTAMTTLQTYVGQLRRVLATALEIDVTEVVDRVLVTETGGYALSTEMLSLDLSEYVRLDLLGVAAVRAGNDEEGARLLRRALDLWHGPALVNVEAGPLLEAQISRLEESRRCAQEHRIIADLRLGAHHTVVGELFELTAMYPLHESLHGHLMLALYRCGRRSEALAVFRALRSRLVDELGLEPSAELLHLQRSILAADPALNAPGRDRGRLRVNAS